jgi:UDP-N-acetylmuramoyl-tripeptide--D-alanyl-D-alanine ligase
MVERPHSSEQDVAIIEVGDTREALGAVAREWRRRWSIADERRRVIGITGSAGKTTTKELLATALSIEGRALATVGSLNNETGVPLTLLRLRLFHDHAVIEMGMRGLGQIDYLTDIAEPDVGVVVNAGIAHVGVVGSVEAIAQGKAEIFGNLPEPGCAVHPAGDARLAEFAKQAPRVLTFGEEEAADVRLTGYRPRGTSGAELDITFDGATHTVLLPMFGKHNALNACCAVAAAIGAGVEAAPAIARLAHARPPAMRGEVTDIAQRHVIVDCYNSNPAAVEAALQTLGELTPRGARALAVLGDMLELGDEAAEAHQNAGRSAAQRGMRVVALGEFAPNVVAGAKQAGGEADSAPDPGAAAELIMRHTEPGDWIVVKASRGMKLERVIDAMRELGGS